MQEHLDNRLEILKAKSPELNRSDFLRHKVTYEKFAELIEEKENIKALIVGLANLEEPLVCLATFENNKKDKNSILNLQLLDIQEKENFEKIINETEKFSLGKSIFDQKPRQPLEFIQNSFEKNRPEDEEYFFKQNIVSELKDVVEKGKYGISIENKNDLDEAGILNKKYDFVSCNNVLQYIEQHNFESTLNQLLNLVDLNGIISLRTDAQHNKIKNYIKENRNDFEKIAKGVYKKIK